MDLARYSEALARCYIETDAATTDLARAGRGPFPSPAPARAGRLRHRATFSRQARYFQAHNARRIDAIRVEIERRWAGHPFHPILLTALLEAADRVDSTTGVQMAYLKQWSARSHQPLGAAPPDAAGRARARRAGRRHRRRR